MLSMMQFTARTSMSCTPIREILASCRTCFKSRRQNLLTVGTCFAPKKSKEKGLVDSSSPAKHFELPYIFKATKHGKHGHGKLQFELPYLFKPERSTDLDDDTTDVFAELKRSVAEKECVLILQPNFKWGRDRFLTRLAEHRLDEAKGLINSVQNWTVAAGQIESVHDHHSKTFFGPNKMEDLSVHIKAMIDVNGVTMVFLNTGCLRLTQIKELESHFGCKVFDRYRVVLEIFKERAKTKEAKLQVQLAEIQYLRTHITQEDFDFDQQAGGQRFVAGSGETHLEKVRRRLARKESKIKSQLDQIRAQRAQVRSDRIKKKVPQVALVGYTNAGKTTLAKVLSHDDTLVPEDKLFATLDSTAHKGKLPSGLNVVYIDTVGFISDLPHDLVESFSTTLEDVKNADVLVHVRDITHPESDLQKSTVLDVLSQLRLSKDLLENMIEVHNKADLWETLMPREGSDLICTVSAVQGSGVNELKSMIDKKIMAVTGRRILVIKISAEGKELSWLYQHGVVMDTSAADDGSLSVTAILDQSAVMKYESTFKTKLPS